MSEPNIASKPSDSTEDEPEATDRARMTPLAAQAEATIVRESEIEGDADDEVDNLDDCDADSEEDDEDGWDDDADDWDDGEAVEVNGQVGY